MKWIGVSTNIAISLKMCLQDLGAVAVLKIPLEIQ